MSSPLRLTGLATGLDVDTMVKQLMRAESVKVDKVKQQRQIVQWKQDLYRELIGEVNTFKSSYFDVLKPDNYMLSEKNYSGFDTKTSDSDKVLSANASAGAIAGDYKVFVTQLAKTAKIESTSLINVEEAPNDIQFAAVIDDTNKKFNIKFADGVNYEIALDDTEKGNYYLPDLAAKINSRLTSVKNVDTGSTGNNISDKVTAAVSEDGKSIRFIGLKTFSSEQTLKITDSNAGKTYTIKIPQGTYSMDGIATTINSSLKTAIDDATGNYADISNLVNGIKTSDDGTQISYDLKPGISADNNFATTIDITNAVNEIPAKQNNFDYERKIIKDFNDKLTIKIDQTEYNITLPDTITYGKASDGSSMTDVEIKNALIGEIKSRMVPEVASTLDVRLSLDGSRIQFVSNSNKTITVSGSASKMLGYSSSFGVSQSVDDKVSTMFDGNDYLSVDNKTITPDGKVTFIINDGSKDVEFNYDFNDATKEKNKTISDIADDIASKANVKLSYSQLTKKFTLESLTTGQFQNISIELKSGTNEDNTTKFLTTLFGAHDSNSDGKFDKTSVQGSDAVVTIKDPTMDPAAGGIQVVKSSNNFSIDGITYNLNAAGGNAANPIVLTVSSNSQKVYDKIKAFIDKYNDVIDKINTKINEKKQYSYSPLTDEQKKEMSEDDIKQWEQKAKEGLLSNDGTLQNLLNSMRKAFYDPVKVSYTDPIGSSIGISLKDIGLSTSNDYTQRGKIIIDETKLKDAIQKNGDKLTKLFTRVSPTVPNYSANYAQESDKDNRYNESGIIGRISDILQNNLRTFRDNNGKKGILLEVAGIKGDYTEYHNFLTDELNRKEDKIDELNQKLADKESRYYIQFSKLEEAMQRLNNQSSWLAQQLGGMSGGQ